MLTNMNGISRTNFWAVFFRIKKKYPTWSNKKVIVVTRKVLARSAQEVYMDFYFEEEMKYKKKARPKQNKRSNHKHNYIPCVIEYPNNWYNTSGLNYEKMIPEIRAYCPTCMKLSSLSNEVYGEYFISRVEGEHGWVYCEKPTEKGERELNRESRTLDCFCVKTPFDKFIEIE